MKKSLFLLPLLACVMSLTSCPGPAGSDSTSTVPFEEGPWNDALVEGETALEDVINVEDGTMVTVRGTITGHSGSSFGLYRNGHWLYVYNIQPSSAPKEGETDNRIWTEGELPTGSYVEVTAIKSSYNGSAQLSGYNDGAYVDGRELEVIKEDGQTVTPVVFNDSTSYDAATTNGALVSIDGFATSDNLAYVAGEETTITWGDPVDPAARFEVRMESYHSDETANALIESFPTFEKYHYYTFTGMAVKTSSAWRMLLVDSSTIVASSKDAYVPPAAEEVLTPKGFYDTPETSLEISYGTFHDLKVEIKPALAEQDLEVTVPSDAKFTVENRGDNIFRISPTENVTTEPAAVKFTAKSNAELSEDVYVKVLAATMTDLPDGVYRASVTSDVLKVGANDVEINLKAPADGLAYPTLRVEIGDVKEINEKYKEFTITNKSYAKLTAPEGTTITNVNTITFHSNISVYNGENNEAPKVEMVGEPNKNDYNVNYPTTSNVVYIAVDVGTYDQSFDAINVTVQKGELVEKEYLASYTFNHLTSKGTAFDTTKLKEAFDGGYQAGTAASNILSSVDSVTKVYDGNGKGGAHENTAGLIKSGASGDNGVMVLTFSQAISHVDIVCHDWYAKSADYPTNSNKVDVNGVTMLAPYNEAAAGETLTFDLTAASTTLTITTMKRVFIWAIHVY